MAKTGPQKIPGASQAYFYGTGRYSGSDMEVNCGVAHTTEGRSVPTYGGGAQAPTVTGLPDFKAKKIRWYQHYDVDESARALMNKLAGVETNTANVFQIELVGTCDAKNAKTWGGKTAGVDYIYWPDAPEWALAEVAWLVRWLHDYHGVPLTCVKDWLAYGKDSRRPGVTPASYGASPARMSMSAWRTFTGWCGHQHVPENDHGDPGSMNFARVIALAKGDTKPTPPKEAPVALSDADVKRIAKACADEVWKVMAKSDGVYLAPTDDPQYNAEPTHPGHYWSGRTVMADLVRRVRDTQTLVAELVAAQKKES
ncbi:hypothetical protein [Streptomyces globisporus]|uniref:hypothetical protein n=1 Tax=Streptomyces globisporus TaxID=1908 RepID=UPI0036F8D366